MKKFYTLFIITLLACINIVLVGYSTFYFNTEVYNSPNVDVAVNNIAQNYGRSENSNDYYDVYVFPQPRYASQADMLNYKPWEKQMKVDFNSNEQGRRVSGSGGLIDGYWSSSNLNLEKEFDLVTEDDKGNKYPGPEGKADTRDLYQNTIGKYNLKINENEIIDSMSYRKISNVYKRLTIQQLEDIGIPKTAMLDKADYTYQFTGWTANKSSAISNGYGGMQNLDLIDPLTPLSVIDSTTKDGSEANDHVIYIYPIFAIGKDYNFEKSPKLQPDSVDLNKGSGYDKVHKFLPLIDNYQGLGRVYLMKNIYFSEEDKKNGTNYHLSVDIATNHNNGWPGITSSFGQSEMTEYFPSTGTKHTVSTAPIISDIGYYNVYTIIKTNESSEHWTGNNSNENEDFIDYVDSSTYSSLKADYYYEPMKNITSNIVKIFYASNRITFQTGGFFERAQYFDFKIWVFVERVYEYKITGGPADTFDYFSMSSPTIFKIEPPTNAPQSTYIEYFTAENVYFNSSELTFKYKYDTVTPDGQPTTVTNIYRETIFTLAADNENSDLSYSITPIANPIINQDLKEEYKYSDTYLEKAVGGKTLGPGIDYTYTYEDKLHNQILKVTDPGYYDFYFEVEYDTDETIKEIRVACRKVADVVAYVKLVNYVNKGDKFNRIQPLSGNFIDIEGKKSGSTEPGSFDKAVNNYYSGTSNEFYYTTPSISTNTDFMELNNIKFDKIKASTGEKVEEVSLDTILGDNYELVDHTTGLVVNRKSTSVIRLSHIFYIREKTVS